MTAPLPPFKLVVPPIVIAPDWVIPLAERKRFPVMLRPLWMSKAVVSTTEMFPNDPEDRKRTPPVKRLPESVKVILKVPGAVKLESPVICREPL